MHWAIAAAWRATATLPPLKVERDLPCYIIIDHYYCIRMILRVIVTIIYTSAFDLHVVAMQQAGTVASNVAKFLKTNTSADGLSKFSYLPLGEMLTLGTDFSNIVISL